MTGPAVIRCRPRVAAACLGAVGVWFLLAVGAKPAQAHTDLQSSTPAAGARLEQAPTELTLRFTEDISAQFAHLSLIRGEEPAKRLEVEVRGPVIATPVPSPSDTGGGQVAWKVSYRVVSADGHPVIGTLQFSAPTGFAPSPTPSESVEEIDKDAGVTAGADQREKDDSGTSGGVVIMTAIATGALAATTAAMALVARRRSDGRR